MKNHFNACFRISSASLFGCVFFVFSTIFAFAGVDGFNVDDWNVSNWNVSGQNVGKTTEGDQTEYFSATNKNFSYFANFICFKNNFKSLFETAEENSFSADNFFYVFQNIGVKTESGENLTDAVTGTEATNSETDSEEAASENERAEKTCILITRDSKKRPESLQTPIIRFEPKKTDLSKKSEETIDRNDQNKPLNETEDSKEAKNAEGTENLEKTENSAEDGIPSDESFDISSVDVDGVSVDLIGAVHIADEEYYSELNQKFKEYDVVLFELVTDIESFDPSDLNKNDSNTLSKSDSQKTKAEKSDEKKEKGKKSDVKESDTKKNGAKNDNNGLNPFNVVGPLQQLMSTMLGFSYQIHCIDYSALNFVHADMDTQTFQKRMFDDGEFQDILYKSFQDAFKKNQESENEQKTMGNLYATLFVRDRKTSFRRLFAEELSHAEEESSLRSGRDGDDTIITARNRIALKRLQEQILAGKKKIAIFYGSAHLPDMVEHLQKDFQMEQTDLDWIIAWDMSKKRNLRSGEQTNSDSSRSNGSNTDR